MTLDLKTILTQLPWLDLLNAAGELVATMMENAQQQGLYEVLDYETTLTLHDVRGERATVAKRQTVRYRQDHILAYQDQAWGDGEILLNYTCTPGVPVDRYRLGHKTLVLISLRQAKHLGDEDTFRFNWDIRRGFLRSHEQWETEIQHRTRQVQVNVVFPQGRPPTQATLIESSTQRSIDLRGTIEELPDGGWSVGWGKAYPRLHERYILAWRW